MSRLPVPGSDDSVWGAILNDFLDVEHTADGVLKIRSDGALSPTSLGALSTSSNLSDLTSASSARTNLGLGNAATYNIGTTSGTVAAGNDSRFVASGTYVDLTSNQAKTGTLTAPLYDKGGEIFNVKAYGAKVDGSTDDTAAIQSALSAAASAGGGTVYIPSGTVVVSSTLVLGNHVWLRGAGMKASTISLANGSNCTVVTNFVSPDGVVANAQFCAVIDLQIEGNASNQSGTAHGISFTCNPANASATHDDQYDSHQMVANVKIHNVLTNGFNASGRSEMRLHNVYVAEAGANSFVPSYDTFMASCTSEYSGYEGFYIGHSNDMLVDCKAFDSGRTDVTRGDGFLITGLGDSVVLSSCNAQNNLGRGFHILNSYSTVMQACMSDSNNFGTGNANSAYAGVEIVNSNYCIVDFASVQSYQNGSLVGNQYNALRIQSSSNNTVTLSHFAQVGYTAGPALTSDSTVGTNTISINGAPIFPSVQTPSILDANGNKVFGVVASTNAANYVQVQNEQTGIGPVISPNGSDTNTNLTLQAKGSGYLQLASNNVTWQGSLSSPNLSQNANSTTSGVNMVITAQAALSTGANLNGGYLQLRPGQSTGGGGSYVELYGNTLAAGPIGSVTVSSGGTGYATNDVLTISVGSGDATVTVNSVNGSGVIQTYILTNPGTSYAIATSQPTTGGTGTGATFNVTALTGTGSNAYTSLLTVGGIASGIAMGAGVFPDATGAQLVTINPGAKIVNGDYTSLVITGSTTTNPTGGLYGAKFAPTNSPANGVTNNYLVAVKAAPTMNGAGTLSNVVGVWTTPQISGSGTVTTMSGYMNTPYITSGQVTNYYAYNANTPGGTGGAVGSYYGYTVAALGTGVSQQNFTGVSIGNNSATTTAYGINVGNITSAGTAYAIYTNTGPVSIGDQLILRSATPLKIASGATAGYLLQSDASGNATWSNQLTVNTLGASGTVTMNGTTDSMPFTTNYSTTSSYAAGGLYGAGFAVSANPGTGNTANWIAGSKAAANMSGAGTVSNMYGVVGTLQNSSTGTVTQATGFNVVPYLSGAGVISSFNGVSLNAPAGTTNGTWTNYTGFSISPLGTSGAQQTFTGININVNSATTTAYGIQIANITSAGTAYAIYTNTGKVSLGDQLILRSATPLQISSSAAAGRVLTSDVSGNATWQAVSTIDGVTVSGVASNGSAIVATSGSAASWTAVPTTAANTFTGNQTAPAIIASGLSGATAASRYVGATTSGAPTSGTFAIGDFVIDQTGKLWICTAAGTPGTWAAGANVTIDVTATDIQAPGTQTAGSTGKAADAGHIHPAPFWLPSDNGLLVANASIQTISNTFQPVAASLYLMKVWIRSAITATNIWFIVGTAGVGTSTGSYAGVYSSTGTLLSGSSDIGTKLTTSGATQVTLTSAQSLSAGTFVWVAVVTNGLSTQPILRAYATPTLTIPNLNLSAANYACAVNGTSVASLPGSITPASNTTSGATIWVGIN